MASPSSPPPPPPPDEEPADGQGMAWASVALYSVLFVALLVLFVFNILLRRKKAQNREMKELEAASTPAGNFDSGGGDGRISLWRRVFRYVMKIRFAFFSLALLFCVVRIAWAVTLATKSGGAEAHFVLNRLALALFFSCFSLVLLHGLRRYYGGASKHAQVILRRWTWVIIVANAVVFVFFLVLLLTLAATIEVSREGHPLYEVNILFVAFLNLVLGAVFLYYGWQLWQVVRHSGDPDPTSNRRQTLIAVMTGVLFLAFVLRCCMFLYRPITDEYLPTGVWYTFAYWLPEIIPMGMQASYVHFSMYEKTKQRSNIDDLYREAEQSGETTSHGTELGHVDPELELRDSAYDPVVL